MRGLPSRWPTYCLMIGATVAILAVGFSVPVALGHPEGPAASTPTTSSAPVQAQDHDSRPPPLYNDVPIVKGAQPAAGTQLLASDAGITPSSITIGVILVALGAVSAFGIDVSSLDPKIQRTYWDDAIARVNAAGGVQGRTLNVVYTTADILSTDSMRAACRSLTEDHHVFAVVNVLGVAGDPILCVTRDHATPYLGIDGADPSYYSLSQGRLVTLEPSTTRTLQILFDRLRALTALSGRRVGLVHPTGPAGVDSGALRSAAAADHARSVADGPLGAGDPLVVSGQVAAAQQRMQHAGVDTVLLLTNAVYGTVFATQADQSRYAPTYVMSDLGYATAGDSFLANMPPSFFHHAFAITTTEIGRGRAKLAESALDAGCRHDFEKAAGKTAARDSADAAAALASCAIVQLVTMGINGAGANPTRGSFATALAHAGSFAVPGFGRARLSPDRLDAADEVSVATADGTCQCFTAVDGFRPAP